jgi:hypothetical protein
MTSLDPRYIDEIVKSAGTGISKLSEWSKNADMLARAGEPMTSFSKVLNNLKIFQLASGVSAFLGLVDGGLQLYCLLNGIPSTEEKILRSLQDISSQTTCLSLQLDSMYNALVTQIEKSAARQVLVNDVAFIKELSQEVKIYFDEQKEKKDTQLIESRIFGENNNKCADKQVILHTAVIKFHAAAKASGSEVQNNLIEAVYQETYGDFKSVMSQGNYLLQYAVQALFLHGLLSARMCSTKDPSKAKTYLDDQREEAKRLYGDYMNGLAEAINNYGNKCIDDWKLNVIRYIEVEFNQKYIVADSNSYEQLCKNILSGLMNHWAWGDWLVIVNDEISGYSEHGINYHDRYVYKIWHQPFGTKSAKMQLIIAMAYKDPTKSIDNKMREVCDKQVQKLINIPWTDRWSTHKVDGDKVEKALKDFENDIKPQDYKLFAFCWWERHTTIACSTPDRVYHNIPKIKVETDYRPYHRFSPYYETILMV